MNTIDEFPVGTNVNVSRNEFDQFNHDFTGHVIEHNKIDGLVLVRDQDGDVWAVELNQLSHSSDDILHNT